MGVWWFICTQDITSPINRFALKGNLGAHRCRFSCVDFVVGGWDNIFLLYAEQSVWFFCCSQCKVR